MSAGCDCRADSATVCGTIRYGERPGFNPRCSCTCHEEAKRPRMCSECGVRPAVTWRGLCIPCNADTEEDERHF